MMANDIDNFIRAQKSKLKQERQALHGISGQPAADPLQNRQIQQPDPITGGPRTQIRLPDSPRNAFAPQVALQSQFTSQPPQPSYNRLPTYDQPVAYQQPRAPTNFQQQAPPPLQNATSNSADIAERPLVDKLGDYETRRQRINNQRREEYQRLAAIESRRPVRRRANSDGAPDEGATIPGLIEHESAKTRKEQQRNMEYQEFKRQEEQKFRNRLAHKKPPSMAQPPPPPRQEAFVNPALPTAPETSQPVNEVRTPKPRRQHLLEGFNTFGELEKWQDLLISKPPPDNDISRPHRENRLDQLERELLALRNDGFQARPRQVEPPQRKYDDRIDDQVRLPTQVPVASKTIDEGNNKTLVGISDRLSAAARRRDERNREYNQHLEEKAENERTRKAGRFMIDSPRYDDTLTQRRYEDTLRQMLNNPSPRQAPRARESRPQRATKPRNTRLDQELQKLDSLDNQYSAAKTNIYRRDRGLSPPLPDEDDLLQLKTTNSRLPPRAPARYTNRDPVRQAGRPQRVEEDSGVLPVGRNETDSAQKRKKDEYRLELERQIQETKERNRRDKELDRQFVPPAQQQLTRSRSYNDIVETTNVKNKRTTRNIFGDFDNGDLGSSFNKGTSLVNSDLDNLAGGQPGLTPYTTPADDAYHYYGMKNPLEAVGYGEDALLAELGSDVLTRGRSLQSLAPQPQNNAKSSRVRFDESTNGGLTFRSQEDISNVKKQRQKEYADELQRQIIENQKKKQKAKAEQEAYDRKFEAENSGYDPYGRGGGGAPVKDAEGNVQADLRGVLANPGSLSNRQKQPTPRRQPTSDANALRLNLSSTNDNDRYEQRGRSTDPQTTPRSGRRQTNSLGEATHARGGHGIFGQPLTDEQLENRHRFREDLALQIAEKKRLKEQEKEKLRREEEEENQRIEEERRKMKEEEEEERRRKIEKEEEARKKNEETLQQQKREEEEKRQRDLDRQRREDERQPAARNDEDRGQERWIDQRRIESPPVPAVYNAMKKEGRTPTPRSVKTPQSRRSARDHPPPSIGGRAPEPARETARDRPKEEQVGSNVALRDLRRMKQQLNTEKERVERALLQQHYSVEVHDPRLAAKPVQQGGVFISNPPVAVVKRATPDVFDTARERAKPVPVRRRNISRTDIPDERQLRDFKDIKLGDTDTGRVIRDAHPATPLSARQLENQQEAFIREQEERLRRLQLNSFNGSRFAADMPGMSPADLGIMTRRGVASPEGGRQLHSETAFISLSGAPFRSSENPWHIAPEAPIHPLEDIRAVGGDSIDPDYLTKKNEERWRSLRAMERENEELNTNHDSEEVLARFMEKQGRRSNPGSVSSFPRSKPFNQPPRAPSSGLAGIPSRTYAFNDDLNTVNALDPVHESALDGPLEPDPVSEFTNRDAAVARTNVNPSGDVQLPYKDGPTPLDDTWIQADY